MAVIGYSGSIWTYSSEFILMPKIIISTKFCDDSLSKFSIQGLKLYQSVSMAAICYSCTISAAPTNKKLLGKICTFANLQNDISKTEWLVHVVVVRTKNSFHRQHRIFGLHSTLKVFMLLFAICFLCISIFFFHFEVFRVHLAIVIYLSAFVVWLSCGWC